MDEINTLNTDTPRVNYTPLLELDLYFGLKSKLLLLNENLKIDDHYSGEVDVLDYKGGSLACTIIEFEQFLGKLDKSQVYRVKGVFPIENNRGLIINWAFGRFEWHNVEYMGEIRVTVMGVGLFALKKRFGELFQCLEMHFHPQKRLD